jgi:indolepyruvate ferredoxin oxidoreductase beta subunit
VKQQIVVSGRGGQGVLFVTRLLAEAGLEVGADVLTSETHGMAMRGGTVISHIKIGDFRSPLIRKGRADVGLFLTDANIPIHGAYVRPGGRRIVNTDHPGQYAGIDATACAKELGSLLATNLVLLGFAVRKGALFCDEGVMREVIRKTSRPSQVELNLRGFERGLQLSV